MGALIVEMAVQVSVIGLYLPPVRTKSVPSYPPQIIISVPVQTAEWALRGAGALLTEVGIQVSVLGLYLPPVFQSVGGEGEELAPPQTIISLPVQSAV